MKYIILFCLSLITIGTTAQRFENYFYDETLRLDYDFAGDVHSQRISLIKLNKSPNWYGKKKRLTDIPMEGNGQIIVKSKKTGEMIYRNSFSTLFQEWLTYPEALSISKSFENVFLIPVPKDTVNVTVELKNNKREVLVSMTHEVIPNDILIRKIGDKNVTPYVTLQQAEDTTTCIKIAYIAEGYKTDEMNTFIKDVEVATEAIFTHEPFKSNREKFNIVAVKASSKESGTSKPSSGVWKNTALSSHFDTFYSSRYLTTLSLMDMHDLLAGIPYEHIIVLVNTKEYGGGGILNSYNLSMTHHPSFRPVVVHEFGHSFAGLADEYAYEFEPLELYDKNIEPWEENITTLKDFSTKWADLINKKTLIPTAPIEKNKNIIGVYEGAGYSTKGIYRCYQNCRMRTNDFPEFCPVCNRAIKRVIDFYTK